MAYNKISSETQNMLDSLEKKVENQIVELDEKLVQLKRDLAGAKKHKLSALAQDAIVAKITDSKNLQKNLLKEGVTEAIGQEIEKIQALHWKRIAKIVPQIDSMINGKPNTTVFKHLTTLANMFQKAEDKEKAVGEAILKSNGKLSGRLLDQVIVLEMFAVQKTLFDSTDKFLSSVKINLSDNIVPNDQYPLLARRKKYANLCIQSAREEWNGVWGFSEELSEGLGMPSMFIADARNHYNLAIEILNGSPSKIEAARSMDTSSRDGIHEDVWDFITEDIYDSDVFGPKALKAHRQKVTEQKARMLNTKIHKEIGPVGRKSASRKI